MLAVQLELLSVAAVYVMCSIQALLSAPNPDDPLADNVAQHWKSNEAEAMDTGKHGCNITTHLLASAQWRASLQTCCLQHRMHQIT